MQLGIATGFRAELIACRMVMKFGIKLENAEQGRLKKVEEELEESLLFTFKKLTLTQLEMLLVLSSSLSSVLGVLALPLS